MPRPLHSPRPPRYDSALACNELAAADPKLGRLIERAGPFTLQRRQRAVALRSPASRAIIYQQLHGKAAATIHRRLLEGFCPRLRPSASTPAPNISSTAPTSSSAPPASPHNKALALRDLAAKTLDGTVPTLARIRRMSDEAIIEHLTQVRGIGRWTVEMLLIFRLGRPDVLPVDDYGVRKGFALTFGKLKPADKVTPADLPKPDVMRTPRQNAGSPGRSVASWYLWRACDLAAGKLTPLP